MFDVLVNLNLIRFNFNFNFLPFILIKRLDASYVQLANLKIFVLLNVE